MALVIPAAELGLDDMHNNVSTSGIAEGYTTNKAVYTGTLVAIRNDPEASGVRLWLSLGYSATLEVVVDDDEPVAIDRRPPKTAMHFGS